MVSVRPLEHLVISEDPGIAAVESWIAEARNRTEVLPVERDAGEQALVALQVTSRSPMGAIALETGGLLIDHGWLRVLGGGHPRLPRAIHDFNGVSAGHTARRLPGAMIVAHDAVGGFFALNGGGISGAPGHVFYFPPTSLEWEDVAPSYSDWLVGVLHGDLVSFYEGMRWNGWEYETADLSGDRAFSFYPFLFASGPELRQRSRRAVPIDELWRLYVEDLPRQLAPH